MGLQCQLDSNGTDDLIVFYDIHTIMRSEWSGDMELILNKGSGIPLYKQVKYAITEKIRSGELITGFKMPTERELSERLGISRNTVSAAYKQLEKEGLLISRQGKGTFVAEESDQILREDSQERIMHLVDTGLKEALDYGMEAKDFLHLVEERVNEKLDLIRKASAVYIECNTEQARYFAHQIEAGTGMKCTPLTISDLIEMNDETRLLLYKVKVIVSTFNHVPEVLEYVEGFGKSVLGVAINPDLKTMVRIARLSPDTKLAFVSISEEFKTKVQQTFMSAGLNELDLVYTNTQDPKELASILEERDQILVSPGRLRNVKELVSEDRVIPLLYNLDEGSVATLKQNLLELNIV